MDTGLASVARLVRLFVSVRGGEAGIEAKEHPK